MKKIVLFSMLFYILLISPSNIFAATFGLGLQGGLNTWDAPWADDPVFNTYESEPGVPLGILATLSFFEKWSIACSLTENKYYGNLQYTMIENVSGNNIIYTSDETYLKRTDIDLILSRKLTDHYSIFAGYKNMYTEMLTGNMDYYKNGETGTTNHMEDKIFFEARTHAFGIGNGISLPLSESFFFNINLSLLLVKTTLNIDNYNFMNDDIDPVSLKKFSTAEYTGFGVNSSASLSYFIEPVNTALVLTGRVHYIKYQKGDSDKVKMDDEILPGIYLSVIYYFL